MSDVAERLRARAAVQEAGAFITGCSGSRDSSRFAFATSAGVVHLHGRGAGGWSQVAAHDGAILSLSQDVGDADFLTGGDDNRLCRIDADRLACLELASFRRWVERVTSVRDARGGLIASAAGKQVELRDAAGGLLRCYEHASTVTGLAFDAKGKRIAASHYGGVSLRYVQGKADQPRLLEWKGSHIGVAIHPAGEAVVSAMQENELHGWRLADGHNMRMSGYPQKTQSLSFSRNGRWLATSGADVVVLWPFFGGGPMGKSPSELAGLPGVICRAVCFHPQHELVAAGFADGSVILADVATRKVLPLAQGGHGAVSALAFSADGQAVGFGTEFGRMAVIDLSASQ